MMNTGNQTTSSDWLATRLQTMRAWGIPIIAMITPARALAGLANLKLAPATQEQFLYGDAKRVYGL